MNKCVASGCKETKNLTTQHASYSPERIVYNFCPKHNKGARDLEQARGDRDQRIATQEIINGFPSEILTLNLVGQLRTGPSSYGMDRYNICFVKGGAHGIICPTLRKDDPRGREYREWVSQLPELSKEFWRATETQHQELRVFKSLTVTMIGRDIERKCYRCIDSDGIDSLIRLDTEFIPSIARKVNVLPVRNRLEVAVIARMLCQENSSEFHQETLFS